MNKKPATKEGTVNIFSAIFMGFIFSLVGFALIITGGKVYASNNMNVAIVDCKEDGYEKLIKANRIDPNVVTKAHVQQNCETIKERVDTLLTKYSNGTNDFPVYITGYSVTSCGDHSIGCVENAYQLNENITPVMTIAYNSDYYNLEHTVAHEYIHVLTSHEEDQYLESNSRIWGTVEPSEGVADCGASFFTGKEFVGGSYMSSCSPEQIEISVSVINNTLVK